MNISNKHGQCDEIILNSSIMLNGNAAYSSHCTFKHPTTVDHRTV